MNKIIALLIGVSVVVAAVSVSYFTLPCKLKITTQEEVRVEIDGKEEGVFKAREDGSLKTITLDIKAGSHEIYIKGKMSDAYSSTHSFSFGRTLALTYPPAEEKEEEQVAEVKKEKPATADKADIDKKKKRETSATQNESKTEKREQPKKQSVKEDKPKEVTPPPPPPADNAMLSINIQENVDRIVINGADKGSELAGKRYNEELDEGVYSIQIIPSESTNASQLDTTITLVAKETANLTYPPDYLRLGLIEIKAKRSGGVIFMNGLEVGETKKNKTFKIDKVKMKTTNKIMISHEEYETEEYTVDVIPDSYETKLTYNPKKKPPSEVTMIVTSNVTGASIKLDGDLLPEKTIANQEVKVGVKPGRHDVIFEHEAYKEPFELHAIMFEKGKKQQKLNAEFPSIMMKPAIIKITSSVPDVVIVVNGQELEGPAIEENTPAEFEFMLDEIMQENCLIRVKDKNSEYKPLEVLTTLQAGVLKEVKFINPEPNVIFVEINVNRMNLRSNGQSMEFFLDEESTPVHTYINGEEKIILADVARKVKNLRLAFNSGKYKVFKNYKIDIAEDEQQAVIDARNYNVFIIDSNKENSEVFEKGNGGNYKPLGFTPLELISTTKFFNIGVKAPGQKMKTRVIDTRQTKHLFEFIPPEAERLWDEAELHFFSGISAKLVPAQAFEQLRQADSKYREVLMIVPEYSLAKLRVGMAFVQMLEIESNLAEQSSDNLFISRKAKALKFLKDALASTDDNLIKSLAHYSQAKIDYFEAERTSGDKVSGYRNAISKIDNSIASYRKLDTLPEEYKLIFDGAFAYKALIQQKLYELTNDESFKLEAISTWNSVQFTDIPNPQNPLRPFENPYRKMKEAALHNLRK